MTDVAPGGPRLYVVATSHLDTQWRWTVRDVIRRFLPRTLRENFSLFEVFPDYVLSFEGAFRYMLVEEYYPDDFDRLKQWVDKGRWRIAGSMIDAPDVNLASAESLVRHILYATNYFQQTFGRSSVDIFLPDCFGFPFSLPTIAAHCGLIGFSSQKFGRWMAPAQVPFEFGLWEGPDGSRIAAALKPGGYGERLTEDLSRARRWKLRSNQSEESTDPGIALKYFGIGDRGGSPDEASLFWLERSISSSEYVDVIHSGSDQIFRDLSDEERAGLPVHRGELLLPMHGTGCWTSQAILKQWNRENELLADSAERAAVIASWLAQFPYPSQDLRDSWIRFLWHQMHDDLTGTSIPEAYEISWNDEVLSLNRFTTILTDSVAAIARGLDTRVSGIPLVVFNPLSFEREEIVEAVIDVGDEFSESVRVIGPGGGEVPSQIIARGRTSIRIAFLARLPPLGLTTYDVQPASASCELSTGLSVGDSYLESGHFRVEIDRFGDISRVLDKHLGREILAASARLELVADRSRKWPAWEIRHSDLAEPPRSHQGDVRVEITESGPARVALRVTRRVLGSTIAQTIRLAEGGAGRSVEVVTEADWSTRGHMLKARFPLRARNATATYGLGCGVVERGNNTPEKHEVPAHGWADLSDTEGEWGVSVLTTFKYGWDKPDDGTLRLTLLRSPQALRRFPHQASQDFGHHRFSYALHSHAGSWRKAKIASASARFSQPPLVFRTRQHPGNLGRSIALMDLDTADVAVRAVKRSETGNEVVLRLQETVGSDARVSMRLGHGIGSAREVDGCEREVGTSQVEDGNLHTRLRPFEPKSFAVRMKPPAERLAPLETTFVPLDLDRPALSFHSQSAGPDFDGSGYSIPGELFPSEIMSGEIPFSFATDPDAPHCLECRGQYIVIPDASLDTLFLVLTAAGERDRNATFISGDVSTELEIRSWSRPLGQWRMQRYLLGRPWGEPQPGYVVRTPVAWVATHRHDRRVRDQPYVFCYLFRYSLPLAPGAERVQLPADPEIRLFAATAARLDESALEPAHELFAL